MNDFEIVPDADALAHLSAQAFCASAARAIAQRGKFIVALSGGRTPKALYELLARGSSDQSRFALGGRLFFLWGRTACAARPCR
jgi:6-phosphogluconolactonase